MNNLAIDSKPSDVNTTTAFDNLLVVVNTKPTKDKQCGQNFGPLTECFVREKPNGQSALINNGYAFHRQRDVGMRTIYKCGRVATFKCPAQITKIDQLFYMTVAEHSEGCKNLQNRRKKGELVSCVKS